MRYAVFPHPTGKAVAISQHRKAGYLEKLTISLPRNEERLAVSERLFTHLESLTDFLPEKTLYLFIRKAGYLST